MNQQTTTSNDNRSLVSEYAGTERARVSLAPWAFSAALYGALAWLCWPSLHYQALSLQDQDWLNALAPLSLFDAIGYVGRTPLRPGEDLFFWLIAQSGVILPWRAGMLLVLLLTTAYIQYDATRRGRSWIIGLGAAICFSINPTTFSVVCWLSAAHVGLCGLGILTYFEFASRSLAEDAKHKLSGLVALSGLAFALAFYEIAILAPLVLVAYHRLFPVRGSGRRARGLYLGSAACVAGYLLLQLSATSGLQLWAGRPASELFVSSLRYGLRNLCDWLYPFDSFGVLVSDVPGGDTLENIVCCVMLVVEIALLWMLRRIDPTSVFGGVWFMTFLLPACGLLHFEGSPVAPYHIYLPMLGLAYPGVRLVTLWLERLAERIESQWVRVLIATPITVLLIGSLAPLLAECHYTVQLWGSEERLYLATLRNHPQNAEVLGRLTRDYLGRTQASATEHAPAAEPAWQRWVEIVLMRPAPDSAPTLIRQGSALIERERYVEAASAFARALGASANGSERRDAGMKLLNALSHTDQHARATPLLERLRRDYPVEAEHGEVAP